MKFFFSLAAAALLALSACSDQHHDENLSAGVLPNGSYKGYAIYYSIDSSGNVFHTATYEVDMTVSGAAFSLPDGCAGTISVNLDGTLNFDGSNCMCFCDCNPNANCINDPVLSIRYAISQADGTTVLSTTPDGTDPILADPAAFDEGTHLFVRLKQQ